MKVLMTVMGERRAILDNLYKAIEPHFDEFTLLKLSTDQQTKLSRSLMNLPLGNYDRIVISSRLKRLIPQSRFLRQFPYLIFFDYDNCQNYMKSSPYYGSYVKFYKKLPGCRVISSGFQVTRALEDDGINAEFVPKGFDDQTIRNFQTQRTVRAGFLGSTKHKMYADRVEMLEQISKLTNLVIRRTSSGEDYVNALNDIRFFVNADSGMNEYMLKNFEALAAGCILVTEDQGATENEIIGFKDMENVILYHTAEEAVNKMAIVESNPELLVKIAMGGHKLAHDQYKFSTLGTKIAAAIAKPLEDRRKFNSSIDKWYARLFYPKFQL